LSHKEVLETCPTFRKISTDIPQEEKISNVSSKTVKFNSLLNYYDKQPFSNYYAPKVICLVSLSPFYWENLKILRTLYKFIMNKRKLKRPIEKIIENLFFEVPNPSRGVYTIEYHLLDEKFILNQPEMNRLPLASLDYNKIFTMPIEQVLDAFKYLILEERVIVFSNDKHTLCSFVEGLVTLLYPFTYSHPYCAILPLVNLPIIENYNSYFIGINGKYNQGAFFKDYNLNISHLSIVIVDLDNNIVTHKTPDSGVGIQNLNRKPWIKEDLDLPKVYKNKLGDSLQAYFREIKHSSGKIDDRDVFIKKIRTDFLIFMISLIQEYSKYIISEDDIDSISKMLKSSTISESWKFLDITIHNLFKADEYISHEVSNERYFYKKFFDTKMFFNLIWKKLFPRDNKEKLEILFLDEAIIEYIYNERIFSKKVFHLNNI
jgi:hypothetical protein